MKMKGKENRSPKGNMWSAIPIALLCMIGVRRSRAAAPKGTKSCRTQGDFCSFCLKKWMRCYRGLQGLQEPKLRSKMADVRPQNANRKLERADLMLERAGLRLERSDD